jgi:hypothetical protein
MKRVLSSVFNFYRRWWVPIIAFVLIAGAWAFAVIASLLCVAGGVLQGDAHLSGGEKTVLRVCSPVFAQVGWSGTAISGLFILAVLAFRRLRTRSTS